MRRHTKTDNEMHMQGDGLAASLAELMFMRKYATLLQYNKRMPTDAYQAGDVKSAFKGRGIEMEEIREYQFGDDVRDIDWRVTARKQQPFTKIYNEEHDREIYVWLDLSPKMMFGSQIELKSVTAAKLAALIGWAALANHDRFGCVIFDGKQSWLFKPKYDRGYLTAIFKKIAEISYKGLSAKDDSDEARQKSLRLLQSNLKSRAGVFLIGAVLDTDNEETIIGTMARCSRLFLINIADKLEQKAPPAGQYMVEYGGQKLVFDTDDRSFRRKYSEYFASKMTRKLDFCRKFGCQLINFSADMSYIGALKFF